MASGRLGRGAHLGRALKDASNGDFTALAKTALVWKLGLPAIAAGVGLLLVLVVMIAAIAGSSAALASECNPTIGASRQVAVADESATATAAIPSWLIPIYQAAAARYALGPDGWAYLASVNEQETDFGRDLSTSSAGAQGWMQFEPATWAAYGVAVGHAGAPDPNNPRDAIYAAARYLRASGAPGDWYRAIFAYNHAGWYVDQVQAREQTYVAAPGSTNGQEMVSANTPSVANNAVAVTLQLSGNASMYGDDPVTGFHDSADNNRPALSGATNDLPGIAVYRSDTLGGWWQLQAPNGVVAIIQQTDLGPLPPRTFDINSVAARVIFHYSQTNFPTDQGRWRGSYLGKARPANANTPEQGPGLSAQGPVNGGTVPVSEPGCEPCPTPVSGTATGPGGMVDPLAHATVVAERIDQGVDYAGRGVYVSMAAARIISAGGLGSGWEGGGYVLEQLTDGPESGQAVYMEEGVTPMPGVAAGVQVSAGEPIARIVPGFHSGTELGFAAPSTPGPNYIAAGYSTYAQARGGGYLEGQRTAAGDAFSALLVSLGAPAGLPEGRASTGTFSALPTPAVQQSPLECQNAGQVPAAAADRAVILPDGKAEAPADAPAAVRAMIQAGNQLIGLPYLYGGGHSGWALDPHGYDCSGAVSWVLHAAGYLSSPEASGPLESFGAPGAGRWVTVWANPGHTFIYIAGIRMDTSPQPGDPAGSQSAYGPRWRPANRFTNTFAGRHPIGL